MIVSKAEAQSSTDRQTAAIAVFAIICVLLSWATNSYERHVVEMYIPRRETVSGDFDELIEQFFWLCPVPILILFRRIVRITASYAVVFFGILVGRCYYLLKFFFVGVSAL